MRPRFVRAASGVVVSLCAVARVSAGQSLTGVLVSAMNGEPLPYGTIVVGDSGREWFADAAGHFVLATLPGGTYRMRARQIGFAPIDTTISVADVPVQVVLRLQPVALELATVRVSARRVPECVTTGIPDSVTNPQLAGVFSQLQDNVDRYRILLDEYPFHYRREKHQVVRVEGSDDRKLTFDTVAYLSSDEGRYELGEVIHAVADSAGEYHQLMYVPTFRDLADTAFQAAHCFRFAGQDHGTIRIDFGPASRIRVPDVEGSVYLDARRYVVRRAVFRLTKPDSAVPPIIGLTVTTTFHEIVPLVPVVGSVHSEQQLPPLRSGIWLIFRDAIEEDRLLNYAFDGRGFGDPEPPSPSPQPR